MLSYNPNLKERARTLRSDMTEGEMRLWACLRRKQVEGVPFYRQKPIGEYIADFYAPRARLVVEVDGAQHVEPDHAKDDAERDAYLAGEGLLVLRFSNQQILQELDGVVAAISRVVADRLGRKLPRG
jgi:very-short-patch-repair endonuclease